MRPADIESIKKLPTVFVIFGATGALSQTKLFPALNELSKSNLLPEKFKIVAAARSPHTTGDFINILKENIKDLDENFSSNLDYFQADIAENKNLDKLQKLLDEFEKENGQCTKRVYYMAISQRIYKAAFENLGKSKLNLGCQLHGSRARIVVEKPFGHNLKSARELNAEVSKYFEEDQIYRIDHYLGKETVQNIFAFRFGNELFEPIWNNIYVDNVQITAAEHEGIGKRGEYYEDAGALRDFVQNHLLQLMSLVTMEAPTKFEAANIRKNKLDVLKKVKSLTTEEIKTHTIRGQYEGYQKEEKIKENSQTETYALTRLFIDNSRWQGVPFYLRTGKKLEGKVTSIIVSFKEKGHKIFENFWEKPMPNHITLQIQPNEGIGIRLVAKKPGLETQLEPVDMEFCYKTSFDTPQPDAYERLLMDIILGDQTLFISQQSIEESWRIIDPIEEAWQKGEPQLEIYKPGTWGPESAEELIKKDGRFWLAPLLSICKI